MCTLNTQFPLIQQHSGVLLNIIWLKVYLYMLLQADMLLQGLRVR